MAKIIKSMKKFIEKGGEKGKMKKLALLAICLGIVLYNSLPAYALPVYNVNHDHKFKYVDYESWIDADGSGLISPGDIMWGILRISDITDMVTGTDVWNNLAPPDFAELTGDFSFTVTGIGPSATIPGSFDVFLAGMLSMYYDTTPNWSPGVMPGVMGGTAHLNATDGIPYLSGGSVYWFGRGAIAPPFPGTVADVFGGVDLFFNGTGYPWAKVTDTDPAILATLGGFFPVDFYLNGNLYSTSTLGWTFRSEDPVIGHPTPEPTSLLLLGSGLLGIATLGMRKRKLAS